jgi:Ca2+-transporting ATPase
MGLVGISDTVRTGVHEAVAAAREAGVRVVMITGDYPETAKAVGTKVGIYQEGDAVVTGADLASLSEETLAAILPKASIFARVTPEDKLKIIEAYRRQKIVIAMTGDGVNDALSLTAADLGVSMGKIGTEVAKEASDMVLLDDNFGSIVSAIEEGRNIYHTIKKVMIYLLSCGVGVVLTITAAIVFGYPLPLLAGQIIWLNFVTDGFLVVALALEPKEVRALSSTRRRTGPMITPSMIRRTSIISVTMASVSLLLFIAYLDRGFALASTVALTSLAVCQWINAFNCRSEIRSVFGRHAFGNPYLFGALGIIVTLQLLAVYWGPLQSLLSTAPLTLSDWKVIVGASTAIIVVEETRKLFARLLRHLK